MSKVAYAVQLAALAAQDPDVTAIVEIAGDGAERSVTRGELEERALRGATALLSQGIQQGDMVAIRVPNGVDHFAAAISAWKVGACVLPLDPRLPAPAMTATLNSAGAALVVGDGSGLIRSLPIDRFFEHEPALGAVLSDRVAQPSKAIPSGGSTGQPKVIVDMRPWIVTPGAAAGPLGARLGMRPGQVQLVAGPLSHNTSFTWGHLGLADGHTLVVLRRFDAELAWRAFERHEVQFVGLVPTMMKRMLESDSKSEGAVKALEGVFHAGGPCPPQVKRAWIDLVGPTRLHEAYGATEGVGATVIRGDEWLEHPGSVGRPFGCEIRILGEDGAAVATGEVGEIFMRPSDPEADPAELGFRYLGEAEPRATADGFVSYGDLGHADNQGYLYLNDRRADLIVSGGANVYPAEVEAVLHEHPAVRDAAVIGLPDQEWGKRVHAIVALQAGASAPSEDELREFCRQRIARYKVPKGFEIVDDFPRNEAGKINRTALRERRQLEADADTNGSRR